MKKLILTLLAVLLLAGTGYAVEEDMVILWEQDCIDGCPDNVPAVGAVEEWRIYMGDAPGVYDPTPVITIPYDGTPQESYSSDYVLTLSGAGIKYCIVRSWNADAGESGDSLPASYPYNFAGSATPVNVTFTIKSAP